jgi:imidazoleglycerol-phosphate dehydratase|tara:strand:- start:669 stop:1277 length:609 start_codon:yes stop_codon:yes gene_type:complete
MNELVEKNRIASETRETRETNIVASINLDGTGLYEIKTGDPMFDHLVEQLSRHSLININLKAEGDNITDKHHLIEDVSIILGRLLRTALNDGKGIYRMGFALIPLDEVLARVAVDLSGRGYAVVKTGLEGVMIGTFNGELVEHFLARFAIESRMNLNAQVLEGSDPHHKAEALFKGLARALRTAVKIDPAISHVIPSTKGSL